MVRGAVLLRSAARRVFATTTALLLPAMTQVHAFTTTYGTGMRPWRQEVAGACSYGTGMRPWRQEVAGASVALQASSPDAAPDTYRAIRVPVHGGAGVLERTTLPRPQLPHGLAVRVSIRCVGVNYHDTYTRSGLYPNKLPFTNGCEGAGVITEVGPDVTNVMVGDRVAFFEYNCAYASEAVIDAASCFKLPEEVSFEIGAAVLVQGLTAHYLATDSFSLGPQHTCVVHAAGGGTGALLVQIAKLRGAKVIATAFRGPKCEAARAAGADHVVAYDDTYDFLSRVMDICPDGVHCVYDSIGAKTCLASLQALRARGTCVLYGNSSGAPPAIPPTPALAEKSLYMHRPVLQHFLASEEERQRRSSDLFRWLSEGQLQVHKHANVVEAMLLTNVCQPVSGCAVHEICSRGMRKQSRRRCMVSVGV